MMYSSSHKYMCFPVSQQKNKKGCCSKMWTTLSDPHPQPPRRSRNNSGDCTTALSEWSGLRCETLMSDAGMGEQQTVEAILHPDLRAWEQLLNARTVDQGGTAAVDADLPFPAKLRLAQLKLAALRDALLLVPSVLGETSPDSLESRQRGRARWEVSPAWLVHSQEGCHVEEVRGLPYHHRTLHRRRGFWFVQITANVIAKHCRIERCVASSACMHVCSAPCPPELAPALV